VKGLGQLLPLLLLGVFFYLLVLRPAQRRQRAALAVQNELTPGVQVLTTGGLYGTVTAVIDDRVRIEIAPGVVVEYVKGAIGKVIPLVPDEEEPGDAHYDSTSDPTQS